MSLTAESTIKKSQYLENSQSSQEKSACDTFVDITQTDHTEEQQTFKVLDDLLNPALIELDNGEISHKTFKEIVNEALEKISRESN